MCASTHLKKCTISSQIGDHCCCNTLTYIHITNNNKSNETSQCVYLLRVDIILTARSTSCAYMGSCEGEVKLASAAAMLLVFIMVSFWDDSFINKVRFMAC